MPKITTTATTITIIVNRGIALDFGVPTTMGVPVKADAGIVPDTVSGEVNVVATKTQVLPFQYSMTLALVKLGFEMLTVTVSLVAHPPLVGMVPMTL